MWRRRGWIRYNKIISDDMSTRCNIAIKLKPQDINRRLSNGKYSIVPHKPYLQVYCHNDGYPEGVGRDLIEEGLTNYDDVLNFILEGNRSTVGTSYMKWRDDPWAEVHPENYDKPQCEQIYLYVFRNNDWFVSEDGVRFKRLNRVLNESLDENKKLSLNEGFFNPFDEDDDIDKIEDVLRPESEVNIKPFDKMVKNVKLWDSNRKNKIYIKDNKVYSSRIFVKDDIVEECPVKLLSTSSLYSPEIREMAFEIDPEKRLYGIPAGLANYYRNSEDTGIEGNIDYEYDPKEGLIRIYALRKIRPNEELVFKVENERNFVNEVKKYQFKY